MRSKRTRFGCAWLAVFVLVCLSLTGCEKPEPLQVQGPGAGPFATYPCTEVVFVAGEEADPGLMAKAVDGVNFYGECNTTLPGAGTAATDDKTVTYFYPVFYRTDVPVTSITVDCQGAEQGSAAYGGVHGAYTSIILPGPGTYTATITIKAPKKQTFATVCTFNVPSNAGPMDTTESLFDSVFFYQAMLRGWEYVKDLNIYTGLADYAESLGFSNTILPNVMVNPKGRELQQALTECAAEITASLKAGETIYDTPDKVRRGTPLMRLLAWKGVSQPTDEELAGMIEAMDFSRIELRT